MNLTYPDLAYLNFFDKIKALKGELELAETISRDDILTSAINKRLHSVLLRYNEEIDATSDYLLRKASAKVLKEITRINKHDDLSVIKQYLVDDIDLDTLEREQNGIE